MTAARLYAHRGAGKELPENTLPAFARAIEVGANALETDVHMTQDGHIVVSHDATGARMANTPRAIRDATLAEVKTWDVGWGFVDARGARPFAARGFRIPTLSELLDAHPSVPINVDAKPRTPDIVPALLATVRRARAEDRTLLASFDVRTLRRVRALGYEGETGLAQAEVLALLLLPSRVLRAAGLARFIGGAAAQLPHRYGAIDLGARSVIDKCHRLGLVVHYWTVNSIERARELVERGADGIMTDDPACLAASWQRPRSGPAEEAQRRIE